MENDNLKSFTIQIAGENYPVRLTESEMVLAKEIEKEIKQKIADFKVKYMVQNTKDILAMVLLTYAFEAKLGQKNDSIDKANQKIELLLGMFNTINS